jgi:hypothetical protein
VDGWPDGEREVMRTRVLSPVALFCLLVLFFAVRGHPESPAAVATEPVPPISWDRPARLDRSGDDLFWTVTGRLGAGTPVGTVHRSHNDVLTVAYRTFGASLGDVAGGRFVVANDFARGVSRIELLGGGVLATGPLIGDRDLLLAGGGLYWADERGVRAMPAGGGPVRTLARSAAIRRVALDRGRVYFAEGNTVRSVSASGGAVRTEVTGHDMVTALAVGDGAIYFSELGAGVRRRADVFRTAAPGRVVSEVTLTGRRVTWVDCTEARDDCLIHAYADGVDRSVAAGAGVHDVQDDGITVVYAGSAGIRRQVIGGSQQIGRLQSRTMTS